MQSIQTISFKNRVINAGFWVTVSHIAQQLLRFGSNLILTRLLFPEAFGLMAIMQAVMIGLAMLADIGIHPSIVQNKRGNESGFLNTAWTIQVIQGLLIFLAVLLSSPWLADFYNQPLLSEMLPIVGLSAVISGFNSTKLATATRNLNLNKVSMIEIVTYVISIVITILLAWIYQSVWALIWGTLVGNFFKMLASHYVLQGDINQFAWDRVSAKALFGFGGWIFISSVLTFAAGEGNKLFLAKLLDVNVLALYTLASAMCLIFWQTIAQLAGKILFPAYAEVFRTNPERIHKVLAKSRLIMIVPSWLGALFFVFFGDQLMWFFYDDRYRESGVILQILAMGSLAGVVAGSYTGVLFAKGLVRASTILLVVQIALQLFVASLGYYSYGQHGVVVGIALVSWLLYPVNAYVYHNVGLWQPKIDIPFLIASTLIAFIASDNLLRFLK